MGPEGGLESPDPASRDFDLHGALADTVRDEWDRVEAEAERVRVNRQGREGQKGVIPRAILIVVAAAVLSFEGVMTYFYFAGDSRAGAPAEPVVSEQLADANRARDAMLAVAAALRAYAEKNAGAYPATLGGLVEAGLLPKAPADPKTGAAFEYEVGRNFFSLAVPDPSAYGVEDIRTTKDGVPVIVLSRR
ncbi:MAG: hypothetical protein K8I02_01200 [Candidatus Methylomirabilis sp.]|nr:hypothetical protein [Deltaproteobacteria bacterium]